MPRQIQKTWQVLLAKASDLGVTEIIRAEEGYCLMAAPEGGRGEQDRKTRMNLKLESLIKSTSEIENGVLLDLGDRDRYELNDEYDYHRWAAEYAPRIDDGELLSIAAVDRHVFTRKLSESARAAGFIVVKQEDDPERLQLMCPRFRLPIDSDREIAKMVFSGRSMEEAVADILHWAVRSCRMLQAYAERFVQIFSNYRVYVADHHFVVGHSESQMTPGFDYWALVANPEESEQLFVQGVESLKRYLRFEDIGLNHGALSV